MTRRMAEVQHNSVQGSSPPFGALTPPSFAEIVRRIGHALPDNALFRKTSSLLLGPAGARSGRAFDVTVFDTMKARLHPSDNICEKRVYLTPQHWDPEERARLETFIASGSAPFTFVDVGANAGLYSLFAASAAKAAARPIRIVAIEPDPTMCARMAFNFSASAVSADIVAKAAAASRGALQLTINRKSRGESRVGDAGEITIDASPLADILADRGVASIDAMKVDIEGHEFAALEAFFRNAPATLWPRFLILEISHDDPGRSAKDLVLTQGYRIIFENRLNAVFALG